MMRPAVSALVALLAAVDGGAQTPTFRSHVSGVRMDVLVSMRGRPVLGLTPADFEIRDNGVLQQVDLVSYGEIPLNVVLTFDASQSVTGERLAHLKTAGHALVDALKAEDASALITFSHAVRRHADLVKDRAVIRSALTEVVPSGGTALVDATLAGIITGESDVGRSLLIVFSDGIDSSSWHAPSGVLDVARRADVVVYGVTVGRSPKPEFLSDLSELTGGKLLQLEGTSDLEKTFRSILEEFRQRYLVTFSPGGLPPADGTGWMSASSAQGSRSKRGPAITPIPSRSIRRW